MEIVLYKKFFIIYIIFICFITVNKAGTFNCLDIYHKLFEKLKIECVDECYQNIHNLLIEFISSHSNFDIEQAKVIVITPGGMGREIFTRVTQKRNRYKRWNYHVVLEYQGEVYDFDYISKKAEVLEINAYFDKMYAISHMPKVRVFPAKFYLDHYKDGVNGLIGRVHNDKYKVQTFYQYLGRHDD